MQTNAEVLEPLVQQTMRAARAEEIGAREFSNIAYGVACSQRGKSLGSLFTVLARTVQHCVDDFNAHSLTNADSAFTTADRTDTSVLRALANTTEQQVCDFNVQEGANTASKRHPKIKSLFRHPFSRKGVQHRFQKA